MSAAGKVVVIGSGGREHALAYSLLSSGVPVVLCPGNGGAVGMANVTTAPYTSQAEVVALCAGARVVVVGPEVPLAEGLCDALVAAGVPCFGPSAAAARLETSKAWSKAFMVRHGIPTAAHASFTSLEAAEAFISAAPYRCVVKASGLCAGKGVVVARDKAEALAAARSIMGGAFGAQAGAELVVEEFTEGEEASVLAFSDGKTVVPLPAAQDHKRAWEFDQGALGAPRPAAPHPSTLPTLSRPRAARIPLFYATPPPHPPFPPAGPNTGGMGCYAPAPLVTPPLMQRILSTVLQPCITGCAAEGHPFIGVLFAGLMINPATGALSVLEFNARMGDPETQTLLPLLTTPLLDIVEACCAGRLAEVPVRVRTDCVSAVVCACAAGYPGEYAKGAEIDLSAGRAGAAAAAVAQGAGAGTTATATATATAYPRTLLFQAGTARASPAAPLLTAGGRVLSAQALAPTRAAALQAAYGVLEDVVYEGKWARADIGGGAWARPHAASRPLRVAVLGSTRGTSLAPVLAAIAAGELRGVEVALVLSNKPQAGILDKARAAGIPALAIDSCAYATREAHEAALNAACTRSEIDLLLLCGYMRIVTQGFTERWMHRMLNVHPSLLPAHAGGMDLAVHSAVLAAGERVSGCTVHIVTPAVDSGFVLVQEACSVLAGDSAESLKARVQALEGSALCTALSLYADGSLLSALRRVGGGWEAWQRLGPHFLPPQRLPTAAALAALAGSAGAGAKLTYAAAGVDIDAGDALVEAIKPMAKSTRRSGADCDLGGFGGLFDLKAAGFRDPLLVSGTDGVGTKLKIAKAAGVHSTVGIDLVAMSVNDLVVQGAEPLVFLDYFATGQLDVAQASAVVAGIAEGCRQAGCALVGGETAEMPSMYHDGDYDLAGFSFGCVAGE